MSVQHPKLPPTLPVGTRQSNDFSGAIVHGQGVFGEDTDPHTGGDRPFHRLVALEHDHPHRDDPPCRERVQREVSRCRPGLTEHECLICQVSRGQSCSVKDRKTRSDEQMERVIGDRPAFHVRIVAIGTDDAEAESAVEHAMDDLIGIPHARGDLDTRIRAMETCEDAWQDRLTEGGTCADD